MTVSNITPVNTYAGNGTANTFDFDFLVEETKQLLVQITNKDGVQTDLVAGVDYSITRLGDANGSSIVFPLPSSQYGILATGEKITLSLQLDIEQEKEYENSNVLNLKTLEYSFDYLTRICQILNREVERAVKTQEGSDVLPEELVDALFNAEQSAKTSANTASEQAQISTDKAQEATDIVTGFDQHAQEKQNDFDINAATLTARYDNNDLEKTNAYNQNAQDMTDGFNTNAMLKIDDFDAHALEKEIAFDDNATTKQALVDASANAAQTSETNAAESERKSQIWAEGEDLDVESLGGTHSAKKWAELAEGAVAGEGLVTIDTDQEIIGHKTFTDDIGSKSNDLDIRVDRNKRGKGLIFIDKNGTQTAGIGSYVNNNGSPEVRLIASNGTQSAFAGLGTTQDGQGFFWGPAPAEGANNEDYVTSHWVQRELTKNYVAKAGDTMTGALNFGTSGYIEANKSNSTKGLAMFGSIDGYAEGASLALRDNTAEGSQAGAFKLETGNNVTGHTHTLQGSPNGSFTCDGKEIVRTINGQEADVNGNIEVSTASNNTRFCANSGLLDEQGNSAILSTTDNKLVLNASTDNPAVLVNAQGEAKTITATTSYDVDFSESVQIKEYIRPILKANGTAGGSEFATWASKIWYDPVNRAAWKAFDEDTGASYSTESWGGQEENGIIWLAWYTPNPVAVPSFTVRNPVTDSGGPFCVKHYKLEYSDNGVDWYTEQDTMLNEEKGSGTYWTFNVVHPVYSKYKRLYFTDWYSTTRTVCIANLAFNNATQKIVASHAEGKKSVYYNFDTNKLEIQNNFVYSDVKPTQATTHDVWFNSNPSIKECKIHNGTSWVDYNACYVGTSDVQNLVIQEVLNAPYNSIQLWNTHNKVSETYPSTIQEVYVNGDSGYRIWGADSTGFRFCEQWGVTPNAPTGQKKIITTFLKPFKDVTYNIFAMPIVPATAGGSAQYFFVNEKTATTFTVSVYSSPQEAGKQWHAWGYIVD